MLYTQLRVKDLPNVFTWWLECQYARALYSLGQWYPTFFLTWGYFYLVEGHEEPQSKNLF